MRSIFANCHVARNWTAIDRAPQVDQYYVFATICGFFAYTWTWSGFYFYFFSVVFSSAVHTDWSGGAGENIIIKGQLGSPVCGQIAM